MGGFVARQAGEAAFPVRLKNTEMATPTCLTDGGFLYSISIYDKAIFLTVLIPLLTAGTRRITMVIAPSAKM